MATACVLAALLGAAGFGYANLAGAADIPKAPSRQPVTLTGHVENLHPGAAATMPVRVQNNTPSRVKVRTVQAKVGDASVDCPGSLLQTSSYRAHRARINPKRTRLVEIRVKMLASTPDACQDATFPIRFRAQVVVMKRETDDGTGRGLGSIY